MDPNEPSDLEDEDNVEVLEEVIDDDEGVDVEMDDGDDPDDVDENEPIVALRDDAEAIFTGHAGSVFCVGLNASASLAATGGVDDKAFVWNVRDGEVALECSGHRDSVVQTCFSHDGMYVATGDMSGFIQVWNLQTKAQVWSFEVSDLEWLGWHFGAHVLFACDSEGNFWMWRLPSGDCKTFSSGAGVAASVAALLPDGVRACVGYNNGTLKLWDLRSGLPQHSITGRDAHTEQVTCMDRHPDLTSELLMTGSADGTANIYNYNSGKLLVSFNCKTGPSDDAEPGASSVEGVGLYRHQPLAAVGTLSQLINIYDVPTKICRFSLANETSVVKLKWDDNAPLLYVADLGGAVSMWDARSGQRETRWLGHVGDILDFELSSRSSVLVTTSEDGTARVFRLQHPER